MVQQKSSLIPAVMHLPLQQSAAHNHTEMFKLKAIANNGEVCEKDGVVWTYDRNKCNIAFPHLVKENATALLDEIMNYYRKKKTTGIGCWSLHPLQYKAMGVKLLARGFQPGWQPNWMAIDLNHINTDYPTPEGLQIVMDNTTDTALVKELPYAGENGAVGPKLIELYPERACRFIAKLHGEVVGQSCVFYTGGHQPTAGLYEVGVVPAARNKGVGKAVVAAACLHAKNNGYQYATLNGTGKKMYEDIGFEHIGYGRTWWIVHDKYITSPPPAKLVFMAEAVGYGREDLLEAAGKYFTAEELNQPMANNMTLMQLAAHCHKPVSGEWLISHGALYTPLDAWNLGMKERAAEILRTNLQEVNRRYEEGGITLLHIAAQKNDMELAQLALSANPDLAIEDKWHDATPLDWARYFERKEIFDLIESHGGRQNHG